MCVCSLRCSVESLFKLYTRNFSVSDDLWGCALVLGWATGDESHRRRRSSKINGYGRRDEVVRFCFRFEFRPRALASFGCSCADALIKHVYTYTYAHQHVDDQPQATSNGVACLFAIFSSNGEHSCGWFLFGARRNWGRTLQ